MFQWKWVWNKTGHIMKVSFITPTTESSSWALWTTRRSESTFLKIPVRYFKKSYSELLFSWYWRRVGLKKKFSRLTVHLKSCIQQKAFQLPECLEQWQLLLFIVVLILICLLIFLISACMHTNRRRAVFRAFINTILFIVTELNYCVHYLFFGCLWVQFNPCFVFFLHCFICLLFTIWCDSAKSG